eukprot:CAMPEP_0169176884 /NCGR_PEP_ID=MMETSP1015-20121227/66185_1 /TAXON_ID=342587 /ORGANISM="Karlodinium micrum, Strain CCMP2283" /LENGTH=40 /DNA_ID= /DNA_START= /DNA_END= /DNA_ORIENTATION=
MAANRKPPMYTNARSKGGKASETKHAEISSSRKLIWPVSK